MHSDALHRYILKLLPESVWLNHSPLLRKNWIKHVWSNFININWFCSALFFAFLLVSFSACFYSVRSLDLLALVFFPSWPRWEKVQLCSCLFLLSFKVILPKLFSNSNTSLALPTNMDENQEWEWQPMVSKTYTNCCICILVSFSLYHFMF